MQELSCTTGPDGTSPAPHSWPFYDNMQQALQQIPENTLHGNRTARTNLENICKTPFLEVKYSETFYIWLLQSISSV